MVYFMKETDRILSVRLVCGHTGDLESVMVNFRLLAGLGLGTWLLPQTPV